MEEFIKHNQKQLEADRVLIWTRNSKLNNKAYFIHSIYCSYIEQ